MTASLETDFPGERSKGKRRMPPKFDDATVRSALEKMGDLILEDGGLYLSAASLAAGAGVTEGAARSWLTGESKKHVFDLIEKYYKDAIKNWNNYALARRQRTAAIASAARAAQRPVLDSEVEDLRMLAKVIRNPVPGRSVYSEMMARGVSRKHFNNIYHWVLGGRPDIIAALDQRDREDIKGWTDSLSGGSKRQARTEDDGASVGPSVAAPASRSDRPQRI
ncbi:hypothetical protein F8271_31665, partial [Micromonospora sp. ALFpr18c]|uniref:hypothetical protein n=1 Tax=Micromonospora sp. ALFpr18c TaxID=1458665 RepID=UPI00124BBE79